VISLVAAVATALMVMESRAVEVSGIKLDDKETVGGVPLVLNGAGLRTKLMLKIYVIGLYLPAKTKSAEAVIGSKDVKRAHLVMKRALGAGTVWDAFAEGIEANSTPAELAALKPKLAEIERLFNELGEVKEGDAIDIDLGADGSTSVLYQGKSKGSIPGTDLQQALLRIWLGQKPVQDDLKKALLGG
jgi:hypothetical protein